VVRTVHAGSCDSPQTAPATTPAWPHRDPSQRCAEGVHVRRRRSGEQASPLLEEDRPGRYSRSMASGRRYQGIVHHLGQRTMPAAHSRHGEPAAGQVHVYSRHSGAPCGLRPAGSRPSDNHRIRARSADLARSRRTDGIVRGELTARAVELCRCRAMPNAAQEVPTPTFGTWTTFTVDICFLKIRTIK
jgi:hypothetical protein